MPFEITEKNELMSVWVIGHTVRFPISSRKNSDPSSIPNIPSSTIVVHPHPVGSVLRVLMIVFNNKDGSHLKFGWKL